MKKKLVIVGILLIGIGLTMFLVGRGFYEYGEFNIQFGESIGWSFGNEGYTRAYTAFWGAFSLLGFIFFIVGIPITIVGAIADEKNSISKTYNQSIGKIKKTSENEDDILKILKLRYAKGEITKENYEQMKKDLEG